ncbi:MAG: nitroreductase family protein [Nitrososphaerales archaeon]
MDAYDCVTTLLDIRAFRAKPVSPEIKSKILESGRLTGSGINTQHWHFVLIENKDSLKTLARDSTTGRWVIESDFAIILLTDPKYGFHLIDAGRAAQDMQLAAWSFGVSSCIFTGFHETDLRRDFEIPLILSPSVVIGFGYSKRPISGKKKNRRELGELVSRDKYGILYEKESSGVTPIRNAV